MLKGTTRPLALLQETLLGQPADDVLAISELMTEMEEACQLMAPVLLRLCAHNEANQETLLDASSLARRMRGPLSALHDWVLSRTIKAALTIDPNALEDFTNFVAMTRSLAQSLGWPAPCRLMHLLGLAMTRARLEAHFGLQPALAVPKAQAGRGLNVVEIAALCGLKLTTVRNAVSRREMPHARDSGVPLDDALDWMVQRSGFLYAHINATTWERRTNGRLAADWLASAPHVVFERYISRLRLSLWHIQSNGRRFALNAEGVRNCVLLLPDVDARMLDGLGLERLDDRSDDPAAIMHREAFMLTPSESLWQCQAPTLRSLNALIERLSCDMCDDQTASA
ncbi:MAG TPA: hypothetical protein VFM75_09565 [Modicisalibacter sp.]|nr:hypothetical protein [Modicisalibacter sp.]